MAVGVALALAVTHPYYVSLGSGGFALIKINSSIKALDFRETAPYKMQPDFLKKAICPLKKEVLRLEFRGFVAGLTELHKKYGNLPWGKLVQPALLLAQKGFPVSGDWVSITKKSKNKLNSNGKAVFFKKDSPTNPMKF